MGANGRYASMWEAQIKAERAATEAREAQARAARAMRKANMGGRQQFEASMDGYNSLASSGTLSGKGSRRRGEEPTSSSSASMESSDAESSTADERSEVRQ